MSDIYEPVIILKPDMVKIADTARIDSFVKIEGGQGVHIGNYVHISSFAHVNIGGGKVILQEHSNVSSGAKILGGSNKKEGLSMSSASPSALQVVERKTTVLREYAFLGVNSVVMPGITIGTGAVIGAGAVVTKDVPDYEIWVGVPAKKIGRRAHTDAY
ncbi:MAG: acyltransferase [Syntrophaceae bacterium]|nr:acyltransferase [Syntrophaceae bacterium]